MARPWYSFYPADYGRDTGHLSLLEHGAYRALMDHYYSTEAPLPRDETRLLHLCRAHTRQERRAVRLVLTEFFDAGEDGYRHKRIDAELIKAEEKFNHLSQAGKAGARKRWHGEAMATPMADAKQSQSQPQSQSKIDSLFEEFWLAYPRKEARGPAVKAWAQALELAPAASIVLAAKAYAVRRVGEDPTYTRLPGNWLLQQCWLDDASSAEGDVQAAAEAASRAWDGRAAKLVADIGAASFSAYFGAAIFSPGPPARIVIAKPHLRALIEQRFSGALRRALGEFTLEAS